MKKIAVFHNYLGAIGGGERLAIEISRILQADLITTDIEPEVVKKLGAQDIKIISLGRTIKFPPAKQISASILFSRADFVKKYDFFIFSGEWAVFAAAKHKPNFYYCHTPPRFFYDLYESNTSRLNFFSKIIARQWVFWHKKFDQKNIAQAERIFCNSRVTQKRVQKYYQREAEIIYPFVQCGCYRFEEPQKYWLSVNRIYPEKRIELQIEAFRQLPELELKIVGGFACGDQAWRYFKRITQNLPANVKILGMVSEEELRQLLSHCRGVVATSAEEDFGLVPLEAMASGKPVVAVGEGGYLETVLEGETGFLVEPEPEKIKEAILEAEKDLMAFCQRAQKQAAKFDLEIFREKILGSAL